MDKKFYEEMLTRYQNKDIDSEKMWDMRAASFNEAVKTDKSGFVDEVVNRLAEAGILEGASVLDIGGGSGRYAIPMARLAQSVTMTDISKNMLDLARENANSQGIDNINYEKMVWETADLAKIGWDAKFDLAFASMCPAVRTPQGLKNMVYSSRKYCLINQFIEATDSLSDFLIERSGVKRGYNPHNDRNAVMASFNLLWMDGYSPEISYLTREDRDVLSVEDILRGYAFVFEDIREKTGLEAEDLIREYKETYCPESQGIEVASRTVLAMILWKV